ncbi:MAG: hypothetical protein JSS89_05330 [Bacteroidetes bacterium]|nr:hypothetical protein [Bacteroidota bacterium]
MSAPFLMGVLVSLFGDKIQWQMGVTCLVVVLIIAGITYSQLKVRLTTIRNLLPLGIGMDAENLYLDRSLWRYGQRVLRIPLGDLRRLNLTRAPKLYASKTPSWFRAVGRVVNDGLSCVHLEYQDRTMKVLYQPVGIATTMSDLHTLLEKLASHPGLTFRIEGDDATREDWLRAAFRTLLEVEDKYIHRQLWWKGIT